MFRKIWIASFAASLPFFARAEAHAEDGDGWNNSSGVNLSVEEGYGARHSGMAITFGGFQIDANAVSNAPAAMNDVDDLTFSTAHAEKFGEAKFDNLVMLVPLEARSSLGIGLSRYGVSGIERHSENRSPLESQPQGLFSVADYLVVAAFSRRFGRTGPIGGHPTGQEGESGWLARWTLDAGANFNMLYRQLDQDGFGIRADGMVQGTWNNRFRTGALLKGLIPSSATWESGYDEYEAPDLYLTAAYRAPAPYFYGTLQVAYQTEGLFQKGGKAQGEAFGSRVFGDPLKSLQAGNLGVEFLFDFGLAVRAGLSEMGLEGGTLSSGAFGVGYTWKKILGLDYSFTPHPDLEASHRIALQFTPAFREFNGRNFRTGGREPVPAAPQVPTEPFQEDDASEAEEPDARIAPPVVPAPPAPSANPGAATAPGPASPPGSAPQSGSTPAPAGAPAAAPAQKTDGKPPARQPVEEILEEEGEEAE